MKKQAREIYLTLSAVIDWPICPFCRYCESDGSSPCSDEGYNTCVCPIEAISRKYEDDYEMPIINDDCWGFSPCIRVADLADLVGIVLAKGWDSGKVQWFKKDGIPHVQGMKPNEEWDWEERKVRVKA